MPKGKGKKWKEEEVRKGDKRRERATREALRRERRYFKEGDPEFKSLSNQLACQGLRMKDVPGDGNCLFRALVDQLGEAPGNHRTLRADIVEYMRRHQEDFAPFMEEEGVSYTDYLRDLAKDGTFGGNDVVVAFSRLTNRSVVIHQPNAPRWEVHPGPSARVTPLTATPTAHIAYLNEEHYCSVVSTHGEESATKLPTAPAKKAWRGNPATTKQQGASRLQYDSHVGMSGISGMSSDTLGGIAVVMQATGCEDQALAERLLQENSYDAQMAIVELLQLMDISEGSLENNSSSSQVMTTQSVTSTCIATPIDTSTITATSPSKPDPKVQVTPVILEPCDNDAAAIIPSCSKQKGGKGCASITGAHLGPTPRKQPQRHLSNRERKELAKRERKERRTEEKRAHSKTKGDAEVLDPVGSLAI